MLVTNMYQEIINLSEMLDIPIDHEFSQILFTTFSPHSYCY